MARSIEAKTIEKYGRFLKIVKDCEGKEIDLNKVMEKFHLPKSTASYARKFKMIDFKGKKILKADYDLVDNQVQPIIARRLIQKMNNVKKENEEKRRLEKMGLQPSNAKVEEIVERKVIKHPSKKDNRPKGFKLRLFGINIMTIVPY